MIQLRPKLDAVPFGNLVTLDLQIARCRGRFKSGGNRLKDLSND